MAPASVTQKRSADTSGVVGSYKRAKPSSTSETPLPSTGDPGIQPESEPASPQMIQEAAVESLDWFKKNYQTSQEKIQVLQQKVAKLEVGNEKFTALKTTLGSLYDSDLPVADKITIWEELSRPYSTQLDGLNGENDPALSAASPMTNLSDPAIPGFFKTAYILEFVSVNGQTPVPMKVPNCIGSQGSPSSR